MHCDPCTFLSIYFTKTNLKKDSILRYTGNHYNEDYALATRGMPYIDKIFKKCDEMPRREDIIDRWKTFTFDQIAKFEETVLPYYTNSGAKNEPKVEDLPVEEGDEAQEDNIYQYYNRTLKKFIRYQKYKDAPTLKKVLEHRFSPQDLEIYRAWKAGAIRRMPLKTELITQVIYLTLLFVDDNHEHIRNQVLFLHEIFNYRAD